MVSVRASKRVGQLPHSERCRTGSVSPKPRVMTCLDSHDVEGAQRCRRAPPIAWADTAPGTCAPAGLETVAKPPPELVEAFAHGVNRFRRESPAPRVVQRPLHAVKGLGGCAIRWPLPAMPAEPQHWHPTVA